MSKTILVDGNSVGHAAHRGTKLRAGDLETQAIYGTLHTIRNLKRRKPNWTPMVLWDGRAEWRFDLHPLYKSNRENDDKKRAERESYKQQRPYIATALQHYQISDHPVIRMMPHVRMLHKPFDIYEMVSAVEACV